MTSIERAFTGGVILSPAATDLLTQPVPLSAFTDLRVASVYQAAVDLYHRSPEVAGDAIAVVAQLQAQGELERVGGAVEVFRLVEEGCNSASVSWHASRMLEAAQIRALGAAAMRIQQQVNTNQATTSAEDTDALVRFAWDQLETATSGVQTRNVLLMSAVFDRWKNREEKPFTPIGLELFTKITGLHGVHQGHVVLVAARPAVGKSTVLAQAAVAAATSGAGVLFVTLEMVGEEVLERCMANQLATSVQSLREYGVAHLPTVLENIRVMDTATAVTDIAASVRQSRRTQTPIELVIVDYLQLLTPPGRTGENRQTEVAAISRALKRLAVDERVGVLAASQLNRALETRSDKRPSMADLRESGQLEADADVIMLMHRDPDEPFEIEFIVAKNRHGANGSFAAEPDFARSLILETRGSDAKAV